MRWSLGGWPLVESSQDTPGWLTLASLVEMGVLRPHLATRALALRPQLSVVTLRRICLYRNHTTSTTVTLAISWPNRRLWRMSSRYEQIARMALLAWEATNPIPSPWHRAPLLLRRVEHTCSKYMRGIRVVKKGWSFSNVRVDNAPQICHISWQIVSRCTYYKWAKP